MVVEEAAGAAATGAGHAEPRGGEGGEVVAFGEARQRPRATTRGGEGVARRRWVRRVGGGDGAGRRRGWRMAAGHVRARPDPELDQG